MNYKKINNLTGWVVFAIALIVYTMTMEVNGSLWDCGEFAGTAARLGVPHPPGAPLFLIITRIFAFLGETFGFGETAGMVFGAGALSSAFTILFLFWTITHFAKKMVQNKVNTTTENGSTSTVNTALIIASGVVGALAFTFSDSFWYSAVETEVYAMSSLCTAVVFWAALKWEDHPLNNEEAGIDGRNQADKWMILIFFILGMSIGIHLLNILTIPPIILIYYYKRYKVSTKGTWIALACSILILGFVQKAVGQWSVSMAFPFDKVFVNVLGFPPISGFVFFFILLGLGFFYLLRYANRNGHRTLRLATWCLIFTLIGMSTYLTTMFRAMAQPGINMYSVTNPYALNGYLAREQYGDFPLVYGQTYEADQVDSKRTGDKYVLAKNEAGDLEYKVSGRNMEAVYDSQDMMMFSRIWHGSESNRKQFYTAWLNPKKEVLQVDYDIQTQRKISQSVYLLFDDEQTANDKANELNQGAQQMNEAAQKNGSGAYITYEVRDHLTQVENMKWLVSYQINWMYLRYFMWNFVGRQNDIQGYGNKRDGNWISGVSFIDNMRLGNQNAIPDAIKNSKAHNKLYFLPLILGVFGLIVQFKRNKRDFIVNGLLFLMTGLAIVGYLNQYGLQPRERDYAFVGSFYAFAVWIGLGVIQLHEWLSKVLKGMAPVAIAAAISFVAVPLLMANVNWDDHDRSKKKTAIDLARTYLNSCPQNAILFTIGDNDTYPLWYAQEVQGIRKDIRVVNTSLLGIDWYLNQLKYKVNESAPFKMVWQPSDYEGSKLDVVYGGSQRVDKTTIDSLQGLLRRCMALSGSEQPSLPIVKYYLDVDVNKASKIFNLAAGDTLASRIESMISPDMRFITKGDLGILNIIAANINDRPICFTDDNGANLRELGLENFLRREGMVYRVVPSNIMMARNTSPMSGGQKVAELDESYKRMMDDKLFGFGNAKTKGVYYDEENRRHLESIRGCFATYATEFVNAGRNKEAAALVKRIHTEMPSYSLPYGVSSRYDNLAQVNLALANAAIECGETEIAKTILTEQTKDARQQMEYYYALSNPGKSIEKAEVDKYIAIYDSVSVIYTQSRLPRDRGMQLKQLEENMIMSGKMDAKTGQELYFSFRNYKQGIQLLEKLKSPSPAVPNGSTTAVGSTKAN